MKLPYSWLKELIPDLEAHLRQRLTQRRASESTLDGSAALDVAAGAEVHELEPLLAGLGLPLEDTVHVPAPPEGVLLVRVTEAAAMEGTQLTRLTLDTGPHGQRTIASGAPNAVGLPAGTMLALVTPGTRLGELEYGVRMLQGVESWGMAASAKELGLGESSAGLMLFPDGTAAPGTPMHTLWPADWVLDVEVTPNRADVLSALGLARDLAAALQLTLHEPPAGPAATEAGEITVVLPERGLTVERDPAQRLRFGCDHFVARTVNGVQNGPSPLWLQRRLMLCGSRSVSAIVDVSNYVMLELGQPTALYDRRAVLGDRIVVGFGLRQGERVADLMGSVHQVGPEDLLIRDGREIQIPTVQEAFRTAGEVQEGTSVLGIAGIVGAEHGAVQADTQDVVIESAHFDPVLLRRTSTRLGLKTDAVYRYERGTDPLLPPRAADRIAALLSDLGGTVHPGATVVGEPARPESIRLDPEYARALLGMEIATSEMQGMLERLGCTVEPQAGQLQVTPPSWRIDLLIQEDLIEEVARLHGYASLPETLPVLLVHPDNAGAEQASLERRELKRAVMGLGFQEVVTYTFTSDEEAARARSERPGVRLRNPLTVERTGLRTALYPSLLRTAQTHSREPRTLIFEVGHIFPASGEAERLGLLMRGPLAPDDHQAGVAGGFRAFRGLLDALASTLGAEVEVRQLRGAAVPEALHPGIAGEVVWNGQPVGWLGALHPEVAASFGLSGDTFLLEVALPLPGRTWAFHDPSRAPAAWRDLAVVAPQAVSYGEIAGLLRQHAGELLESVRPLSVYTGESIAEGQRSVAVRLTFRAGRTLSDAEVDPLMDRLMAAVRAEGWSIRER
ncbi:phenylalanine--tRNA ligase subunit beta [Deinococcus sonorensis]|uniref:Phenylalanine--tRNA ligase beta subunit n=2 Tax=Deinococcus sonorensis TaxID=309891 RepID=A0AAU7UEY3_9DEIO